MLHIHGSYDISLIALSYVIAVLASYTALDLGGRVTAAPGKTRLLWLFGGAIAMGLGIWSMHFVGMLAFQMPVPTRYNVGIVFVSMAMAAASSGVALYVVSRKTLSSFNLLAGGLVMGAGIVAMHYTGMYAMEMPAKVHYHSALVALSAVIAVIASWAAMWLTFSFRDDRTRRGAYRKAGSGLVMGAAIAGMHYTGMAAASFTGDAAAPMPEYNAMNDTLLAYTIGVATVVLLTFTVLVAVVDRRIAYHVRRRSESEQQYKSLFDHNSDGVFQVDLEGKIVSANPAVSRITGYPLETILGTYLHEMKSTKDRDEPLRRFEQTLKGEVQKYDYRMYHKDGRELILNVTSLPIFSQDEVVGVYAIAQDISKRIEAERRITYLAYHDEMTGLPNRGKFIMELTGLLAQDQGDLTLAVLILDIDRFKVINDSIGQSLGDELIRSFVERLRHSIPERAVLARFGSDEFTVMLPNISDAEEARQVAGDILAAVQEPFRLENYELHLTTSIGYSLYPQNGADYETLLKHADTALYHAKRQGKNNAQAYDQQMNMRSQQKLELENGIRKALERGEFELHYQPQIDMNGRLIGAEALVRWRHPEQGMVSPGLFIPTAEESGLIKPLGEWVLREACRQNKRWQDAGFPPVPISVNLSIKQFEQPNLVKIVNSVLQETGLDPQYLDLEITESMAMDVKRATQTLRELKALGLHISMDDFGTGYSSLSYLKQFPIDKLKIDQSFVRDLSAGDEGASIVATIVAMGHHLKLAVIAEGVETKEQFEYLREHRCDQIQGYYFSPPLVPAEFERLWKVTV